VVFTQCFWHGSKSFDDRIISSGSCLPDPHRYNFCEECKKNIIILAKRTIWQQSFTMSRLRLTQIHCVRSVRWTEIIYIWWVSSFKKCCRRIEVLIWKIMTIATNSRRWWWSVQVTDANTSFPCLWHVETLIHVRKYAVRNLNTHGGLFLWCVERQT